MNIIRPASAWRNAIETRFVVVRAQHSCDTLRLLASGRGGIADCGATLYLNYAFGARQAMAIGLRFFDIASLRSLYSWLWMLAVIALFVGAVDAAWRRCLGARADPVGTVVRLRPSPVRQQSHAPGLLWARSRWSRWRCGPRGSASVSRRLAYFAALGALTCYFDLIHGPLLVMLWLGLVIHHFCYARDAAFHSASARPWRRIPRSWSAPCY